MNRERWAIINDEFNIEISNKGRVRNANNKQFENTYLNKNGVPTILIMLKNNKFLPLAIHRIVAKHFCENDDVKNKLFVEHIDGDRSNNDSKNLRWVYKLKTNVDECDEHQKLINRSNNLNEFNKMLNIKARKIDEAFQELRRLKRRNSEIYKKLQLKIVFDIRY